MQFDVSVVHKYNAFISDFRQKGTKESNGCLYATTRLVSRLSERCWQKVLETFKMYKQQQIKDQRPSTGPGLPDCKKSVWYFLHGLEEEQQVLCDISNRKSSFKEAALKAKRIKEEEKVYCL